MEVERLLLEIIQSRKDCVEVGRSNSFGNDLLGMLLNEMQIKRGISSGFSLNQQLIMDEIKTFFFAGHDTTALLLTWTSSSLLVIPRGKIGFAPRLRRCVVVMVVLPQLIISPN